MVAIRPIFFVPGIRISCTGPTFEISGAWQGFELRPGCFVG